MEPEERIREEIRDISLRKKNVTLDDILRVLNKLEGKFTVKTRPTDHGMLVRIDNQIFHICTHHRGSKQVKANYVEDFLDAMTELGLYED